MESRLDHRIQQYENAVSNFGESLSIDLKGLSEKIVDSIKSGKTDSVTFMRKSILKKFISES